MAYTKTMRIDCDATGCKKTATVEVFNNKNASVGRFCKNCAARKMTALTKAGQ